MRSSSEWTPCPFPYHVILPHVSEHAVGDRDRCFLIIGVAPEMECESEPVKRMITFAYICMLIAVAVTPGDR